MKVNVAYDENIQKSPAQSDPSKKFYHKFYFHAINSTEINLKILETELFHKINCYHPTRQHFLSEYFYS